jgi:phage shock protein A
MDEKQETKSRHEEFDFFFNKLAWAAITAVVSFAAYQLNKLSDNVADLNKNMTLVVYQLEGVQRQSLELKSRIETLESRMRYLEVKK